MSAEQPNDPRLEPLRFLEAYGRRHPPRLGFRAGTRAEWMRWQRALREQLARTIGLPAIDESGTAANAPRHLTVVPGPVVRCDGYRRMAFTIETTPGLWAPAFLLIPDGPDARRPAILCSHGHGAGMNDLVGLNAQGEPRTYKDGYQHDFAIQAVRAGFVALAFDQIGFGRRRDIDFHKRHNMGNHCEQPSRNALHWGLTMSGLRVWDAMRMIDFLQSRPEVDPRRIGMAGISGGGLVTQFTAALDDRIRAACVSGYCCRYEACILGVYHCIDNYVPGLGPLADNDDIACLIAPRPLLIEAGRKDPIFPIEAVEAAVQKLRACYGVAGAAEALETDIFDGPHEFSGAHAWAFFERHLGR